MSEKNVLFMARTTRYYEFAQTLTTSLGVDVSAATPDSPTAARDFDLLILDADGIRADRIEQIGKWLDDRGNIPMLVLVDDDGLSGLHLPSRSRCDFICSGASEGELEVRARRLMGEEESFSVDDVLRVDNMTINLATYQVYLDDKPVDLTLMEYSLLSFLAMHPNRAYSREVLLHRVWGFEYCGGTRTVDVHIRRIRSKVGPQIAAHITTVRGVGYLFKG
ncbi:winged-helix domain-containing protein [Collinsella tanakaei]|uniref:Winged-helix domain-containing protein n=1 Tax=Collinsella ihumii TaxID=1720204 RepID=A0A921LQK0_9ACTN|nr:MULTISPECIES: winged-helix domain-containing protein [Collinsella]MBM6687453.1 winged-helix domain-containing protein [Collinsella tanakaei]MBM6777365.1 winged-helix domain-containing protein [Collinsella tanakaei]MBM6785231.1 winged-helix domain-containing protein [Collinsella tanakaei]MBM6906533.1 winged-helix domain-containing protein [Collinsella tanakaei]MCF6413116.1 winged-helix domain-containing protein [Collinsella tanakaei]